MLTPFPRPLRRDRNWFGEAIHVLPLFAFFFFPSTPNLVYFPLAEVLRSKRPTYISKVIDVFMSVLVYGMQDNKDTSSLNLASWRPSSCILQGTPIWSHPPPLPPETRSSELISGDMNWPCHFTSNVVTWQYLCPVLARWRRVQSIHVVLHVDGLEWSLWEMHVIGTLGHLQGV